MRLRSIVILAVLLLLAMEPAIHVHPTGDGKAPCPACSWGQMLALVSDPPRVEPLVASAEMVLPPPFAPVLFAASPTSSRAPPAA